MKKFLILLLMSPLAVWAQKTHTVGPKETLYSLGRQYNVHPRELAEYNNIPVGSGLTIGQVLKIPSKKTLAPLSAPQQPAAKESPKPMQAPSQAPEVKSTPIYHTVAKKETLYQISRSNNTTVELIRKWNNLEGDALKEGAKLIVGYSSSNDRQQKAIAQMPPVVKTEAAPKPALTEPEQIKEKPFEPKPVVKKENEVKPILTETDKPVVAIREQEKPKADEPEKPKPVAVEDVPDNKRSGVTGSGGFFRQAFEEQGGDKKNLRETTGTAAIFKTNSGFEDQKYYCLYNQALPGTIVKITNTSNQQYVFAKVLDVMPDMKKNQGVLIRVSNSALQALGADAETFSCTVSY